MPAQRGWILAEHEGETTPLIVVRKEKGFGDSEVIEVVILTAAEFDEQRKGERRGKDYGVRFPDRLKRIPNSDRRKASEVVDWKAKCEELHVQLGTMKAECERLREEVGYVNRQFDGTISERNEANVRAEQAEAQCEIENKEGWRLSGLLAGANGHIQDLEAKLEKVREYAELLNQIPYIRDHFMLDRIFTILDTQPAQQQEQVKATENWQTFSNVPKDTEWSPTDTNIICSIEELQDGAYQLQREIDALKARA